VQRPKKWDIETKLKKSSFVIVRKFYPCLIFASKALQSPFRVPFRQIVLLSKGRLPHLD